MKTLMVLVMGLALMSCAPAKDGVNGKDGIAGQTGSQGVPGQVGPKGDQGNSGTPGINGTNGHSVLARLESIGANSPCPSGGTAIEMFSDTNDDGVLSEGDTFTGAVSVVCNGVNGTNGTVITAIPFCPNYAPVYPTVFPEVGLCIGNTIFAVYSANGGFLSPIPDGDYQSNAIGSACSFHVAGCNISNQH